MENKIQLFNHPEFGKIRTVDMAGEPWLVGKDVAEALGYQNTSKALFDHVDPEDKLQGDGVTIRDPIGREQHPVIINESGLYSLVLGSKLPGAKKFKRWVTSEVLPSIRKTGGYRMPQSIDPQLKEQIRYISRVRRNLQVSRQNLEEIQPDLEICKKYLADAKAKYGRFRDIERRMKQVVDENTAMLEGAIDALELMATGKLRAEVLDMLARDIDPLEMLGDAADDEM